MHTNVQTYKSDPGLKPFRGVNAKLLYLMHSLIALLLPTQLLEQQERYVT